MFAMTENARKSEPMQNSRGALAGLRVVEFTGIGPGPHCAMLFSDLGAEVVRIDRPGGNGVPNPVIDRGRATIELDIRTDLGRLHALAAANKADVVMEGFRPGVMERLGLGPDVMLAGNSRLVYARMTGWGQSGPLSKVAGHDINYIAVTGALAAITNKDGLPIPPLNLIGDFGGGSLYLAFGILAALWEREKSGKGQIVDAAIIDGVASMMTMFSGLVPSGFISLEPGRNMLAGSAPFYRCYTCADGRHIAVGPVEPHFYAELLERISAPLELREGQHDPEKWESHSEVLVALFATKSREEWSVLLEGTDVCFAPVLTLDEAPQHPQLLARGTFFEQDGVVHAAPAPRFSRTPGRIGVSGDGREVLKNWGVDLP
jgi:alpha-methylacyl-CoA racemase